MSSRSSEDVEFTGFYGRHAPRLVKYAYLICGDSATAEELVADAMAKALPRFRQGRIAEPELYLRRIITNAARRRRRRAALERRELKRTQREGSPHAALDGAVADRLALWPALQELPAGQRAAVVLRYFEDYTEDQTARALNVRVGTVKSRVARGLARLRSTLSDKADLSYEARSDDSRPIRG